MKRAQTATPGKALTAEEKAPKFREPSEGEAVAIAAAKARRAARPHHVQIKHQLEAGKVLRVGQTHSDGRGWSTQLTDTFGTVHETFAEQSLIRIAHAIKDNGTPIPSESQANAALALMGAIAPQNELEAVIAEQIIAAHTASLDFLSRARANAGEYRDSAAAYTGMATKVSRTMVAHVEALARLRSGGKQQVIVKHIHIQGDAYVGDGGQAAFGLETAHPWGGENGNPAQPHALSSMADVAGLPMRSADPEGGDLPSPRSAGKAPVQDARLCAGGGRPEGQGERAVSERAAHPRAARCPRTGSRLSGVGA